MADDLLAIEGPMGEGGGRKTFATGPLTDHSGTNMEVIRRFPPAKVAHMNQ